VANKGVSSKAFFLSFAPRTGCHSLSLIECLPFFYIWRRVGARLLSGGPVFCRTNGKACQSSPHDNNPVPGQFFHSQLMASRAMPAAGNLPGVFMVLAGPPVQLGKAVDRRLPAAAAEMHHHTGRSPLWCGRGCYGREPMR
jgi:hypothetical protein